jgi:hypothetical protein
MQAETIHIKALTAADRLSQAIAVTSNAVDQGRSYVLHVFRDGSLFCATVTLDAAQVAE